MTSPGLIWFNNKVNDKDIWKSQWPKFRNGVLVGDLHGSQGSSWCDNFWTNLINIFLSTCSACIFCQMVCWQFGQHHDQQWLFRSNLAVNRLFISNRSGITTTGLNLKTSKLSKLACAQVLPKSHDRLRGQVFKWIVNCVTSATRSYWQKQR